MFFDKLRTLFNLLLLIWLALSERSESKGAAGQTCTGDPSFFRAVLYYLSYRGAAAVLQWFVGTEGFEPPTFCV